MARPTTIKMGEGEVVLRNLPKEEIERIKALLTGEKSVGQELIEALQETVDVQQSNDTTNYNLPLNETALGFRKNNAGSYELISVKYNVDTKQAIVDKVQNLGENKQIAVYDLKVKMGKLI